MSDERYRIRWKGRILGPFSRREIDQKIQNHELGLLHEIWHEGYWITLREFLGPRTENTPEKSDGEPLANESDSEDSLSQKPAPPSPWLISGYLAVFLMLALCLLGWTQTWIAPSGWAPLLGLGLGLIGGLFGLLTLFQGEKKHGVGIVILSVLLAFGNMMLA